MAAGTCGCRRWGTALAARARGTDVAGDSSRHANVGECENVSMRARQTPSAAEAVAESLRIQIIGDMANDDHIGSAEDLAKRFDVSLPTIRQAMRVLEADGLMRARPGNSGGFFCGHTVCSGGFPFRLGLVAAPGCSCRRCHRLR
jgi:hypothetical protein